MKLLARSPEEFAEEFNNTVAADDWCITPSDVLLLMKCGLIKRYGWFSQADIFTIVGVLTYEQLKIQKEHQAAIAVIEEKCCKSCGTTLPPAFKFGRPREYCVSCERSRSKMRWRRHQQIRQQKTDCYTIKSNAEEEEVNDNADIEATG